MGLGFIGSYLAEEVGMRGIGIREWMLSDESQVSNIQHKATFSVRVVVLYTKETKFPN